MLRLLTDEQISPVVAKQAPARCHGIKIVALHHWQGGHFLSAPDNVVLREAHKEKLTLVTFGLRTIPTLLRSWGEQGIDHGGVVLVDLNDNGTGPRVLFYLEHSITDGR